MQSSTSNQESDTDNPKFSQAEIDLMLSELDSDLPDYSPCRSERVSVDDQTAEPEEVGIDRAPAQEAVAVTPDPEPAPEPIVRSPGFVAALAGWKEQYAKDYRRNWSSLDDAWNGKRKREANAADRAEYAEKNGGIVRRYVQGQHMNEGLTDEERRALMQKESKQRKSGPRVRADLSGKTQEEKAEIKREQAKVRQAKKREIERTEKEVAKDQELAAMKAHPDYGRFG